MAWEPFLKSEDDSPLGSSEEVRQMLCEAFPGTEWVIGPSGEHLLKEQYGGSIPDEWRDSILFQMPASWEGCYNTEPVAVQFKVGLGEEVQCVSIITHGDHIVAQKILRELAWKKGWLLTNDFETG